MNIRLLVLLVSVLVCLSVEATKYRFLHPNQMKWLPDKQIEALVEDGKGNIWIGTRNGLARYDGADMKILQHNQSDNNSLRHNFILQLYVDRKDRLWVCTQSGICRYRPSTNDFVNYPSLSSRVVTLAENSEGVLFTGGHDLCRYDEYADTFVVEAPGYISSIAVDKDDRLYVATNTSILCYNKNLTEVHRINPELYQDITKKYNGKKMLLVDSRNRLWIGQDEYGVTCLDRGTSERKTFRSEILSDGIIHQIREDYGNRIWVGTENGITIIHPDGKIDVLRHDLRDGHSLSDNAIYAILCDSNRNIWIGSYFGGVDLLPYSDGQFEGILPGSRSPNIGCRVPRQMEELPDGTIWIASEDNGIWIYHADTGLSEPFTGIAGMGNNVHALYYDEATEDMWIGTFRDGLYRYNVKTRTSKQYLLSRGVDTGFVIDIGRQNDGRMWIATSLGVRYYDRQRDWFCVYGDEILDQNFVYCLYVDKEDKVWCGTDRFGLYCIDELAKDVKKWMLKDTFITCLFEDSRGLLWVGTSNYGLQYVNTKTGEVGSIDDSMLGGELSVCSIAEDDAGQLWVSTNYGIYRVIFATSPSGQQLHDVKRFTIENGLSTNHFNYSSALLTSKGEMLMGSVNGLVKFLPERISVDKQEFYVHLKSLFVANRQVLASDEDSPLSGELDEAERITLTYDQARLFSIEYGCILPARTIGLRYQVMLKDIDKEWRDVGTESRFTGFNMQEGSYELMIRANDSDDEWDTSPVKRVSIVVKPPIYRSVWAWMLYILILALISWGVSRIILSRIKARKEMSRVRNEKKVLEELSRMKNEFFAIVSHELKTPLSLILAPLKSINREGLDEKTVRRLNMMEDNAGKIKSLVDDLVTAGRVESGDFPMLMRDGNPLAVVEKVTETFKEFAAQKHVRLTIDCEDNGEYICFSALYVEHVVSNLLSNAIKFTPEGGEVNVKAVVDGDESTLCVMVRDTGIGIGQDDLPRVFDSYYQTEVGKSVKYGGWGIGLSLVKRLVELHSGRIEVESILGKGSVFTVWFKGGVAATPQLLGKADYLKSLESEDSLFNNRDINCSILLVEDNEEMTSFLVDYFSEKYNVYTARDGVEALAKLQKYTIQLVVSDVMMPRMDGFSLCKTLKADVMTSHIPVILLTAKNDPTDIVSGYDCGAELYVTKPFDPQLLDLKIKNMLQLRKALQKEILKSDATDAVEHETLTPFDKDFLLRLNDFIDRNMSNSELSVSDIISAMAVSRTLMHVKMKALVGMPITDYVRVYRLEHACKLLREGSSVSDAAYLSGFASPNYFSRAFKARFGITAREWKDSQR